MAFFVPILVFWFSSAAWAAPTEMQVVSDLPLLSCEDVSLAKDLQIYKDPALWQPGGEDDWALETEESPLLTNIRGKVQLMRMGAPKKFKSLKFFRRRVPPDAVHTPEDEAEAIPIKICSLAGYKDSVGFVFLGDLEWAKKDDTKPEGLPPSTRANPVPDLPAIR